MSDAVQITPPRSEARPTTSPADGTRAYLSIKELAAASGLSVSTLNRLRRRGQLVGYQPGGYRSRVVFPADALERAKAAAESQSTIHDVAKEPTRLSGPRPLWMRQGRGQAQSS